MLPLYFFGNNFHTCMPESDRECGRMHIEVDQYLSRNIDLPLVAFRMYFQNCFGTEKTQTGQKYTKTYQKL